MTEEERSRIFEPFYSGFTNGRGLGMALVKKIVEDHDGTIAVRSEPNQGTEVLISLPGRRRTENPIVRGPDS
jgi:two-component system sensor histidine kinase PilS (NtrC family)